MLAYIIVSSGGEYSDAWHINFYCYLIREDAEKAIEETKIEAAKATALYDSCEPYLNELYNKYINENDFENAVPPGTPNRRGQINKLRREAYGLYHKEHREYMESIANNSDLSEEMKKHFITAQNRIVFNADSLSIEEVDLNPKMKLWEKTIPNY